MTQMSFVCNACTYPCHLRIYGIYVGGEPDLPTRCPFGPDDDKHPKWQNEKVGE